MLKPTLTESEVFSRGYEIAGVNPYNKNTNPVFYHLFEAGRAVKTQEEANPRVWDEQKGIWIAKDK